MLNNVTDVLSVVLRGSLGRSGRKRARRATSFLTGHRGFLSTSALIGAAGVAWGIYDTLKAKDQSAIMVPSVPEVPGVPGVQGAGAIPPIPAAFEAALDPVARIIRLAVSAAKADGTLSDQERAAILAHAREAGLESVVEAELAQTRQLADIVHGVTDPAIRKDLYVLAFAIVRADETVSGAERIYLAQLAHQLGLDPAAVQAIEAETSSKIDSQTEN
ncbi:MAG TPA: DUF533 domain-containing protein [Vicinamibacterales bacterium]|nr:DUF533 domain-containing protein [Vicinamibacterales bacterium]